MSIFASKLANLHYTISTVSTTDLSELSRNLARSRGSIAIAIGSGGSFVTAEFFARCRATLGLGYTITMTPMQFVQSLNDWEGSDVWLFSAGSDNHDIAAAYSCALSSKAKNINLMTVRGQGATALAARQDSRSEVYVLPVDDPKDGFLATHSMMSCVAGLLFASDALSELPLRQELHANLIAHASRLTDVGNLGHAVAEFVPGDTMVLLHDTNLAPIARLIETSLWETGIAPVQCTDFRNFAHGRHVWASRHPETMFVLSLTTNESAEIWEPIANALPESVRKSEVRSKGSGRFRNATGLLDGLGIILSLGDKVGIDPARPGTGSFADAIYGSEALARLAKGMTSAVRHKSIARHHHDNFHDECELSICAIGKNRVENLCSANFAGVVLDYDGTVVSTEARLKPPGDDILAELIRLIDSGVMVGIATGRGGSAGEMLRSVLPERTHSQIVMGYYNGGHVRSLDVDIRKDQPVQNNDLLILADLIDGAGLVTEGKLSRGRVQITIAHSRIKDLTAFADAVHQLSPIMSSKIKILSSHHSFDFVPIHTSKLQVVREIGRKNGRLDAPVLSIGDSGSPLGNDCELLSTPNGVSVDSVCGKIDGAWSLFGSRLTGPDALAKILKTLRGNAENLVLDFAGLELD